MSDKRYWLWFILAFGPSNERIWEILSYFKNVEAAYTAICDGNHSSLNGNERRKIVNTHIEQCDSIIKYCEDNDYKIITFEDGIYPPRLRNIYSPPAVLFCMGNIDNFIGRPSITCVGTRKPSVYSVDVTKKICAELSLRGFAIVSGFALGLDSAAHRGALENDGCTVAVLACGIDVNYPRENEKSKKIIAKNGALITEYLPGTRPDRYCFHKRNRILSGLSFGTLVTEADETSGALITAAHAADQGRTVFCIPPGDIFDKRYSGQIKYLRDGAFPAFSHLDIMYEYYISGRYDESDCLFDWPKLLGTDEIPYRDSRTSKRKKSLSEKQTEKSEEAEKPDRIVMQWEQLFDDLDEKQKEIVEFLKDGAKHPDEISIALDMDSFEVMAAITELEMIGAAELMPDHKYKLC